MRVLAVGVGREHQRYRSNNPIDKRRELASQQVQVCEGKMIDVGMHGMVLKEDDGIIDMKYRRVRLCMKSRYLP